MARTLRIMGATVALATAFDPLKIVAQGLFLRKMRAQHPELFDGALAARNVNAQIAAVEAQLGLTPGLRG